MASYNWSELSNGDVFGVDYPTFNPDVDVLVFDDATISAAEIGIDGDETGTFLSLAGKTVTLDVEPFTVTSSNVTFADGSVLVVGDNTTGVTEDDNANTIAGGAGDDQLVGVGGADAISGGGGNDVFTIFGDDTGGYGNDTLDGGSGGRDRVVYGDADFGATVTLGNETAAGSATGGDGEPGSTLTLIGIEAVTGTIYADVFNANSETEINGLRSDITQRFEGGAGNDTINGAADDGRNTVIEYTGAASGVTVDLAAGTASDGDGGTDTFNNIDGVVGSSHDDELIGGSSSASLSGAEIENFEGLAGNDTIDGMGGEDEVRYSLSPEGVVVNLGGGTASDGWGNTDTLFGIERVRGSEHGDLLTGGTGSERFEGLGGNDTINGGTGFDRVRYGRATGAVVVNLGGSAVDLADYGLGAQTVAGGSAEGIAGSSGVGVDNLANIDAAQGSDFDDVLIGGSNATGFGSREEFEGWAGDDTIDGGDLDPASFDLVSFGRDPSGVVVNLSADDLDLGTETVAAGTARDGYGVNGNPAGTDTLININGARGSSFADTLVGGDGNEWFIGNDGDDYVDGGGGNDTIAGSEGNDTSLGGDGNDLFTGAVTATNALRNDARPIFEGGAGNDTIIGAAGDGVITTASYRNSGSGVSVNLFTGVALDGEGGTDTFVISSGSNVDRVIGSMHNDLLVGGGNARSVGGGQTEGFEGLAGHDTIDGGSGSDQAIYDKSPDAVIVNLSAVDVEVGGVTVEGGTARDGFVDAENEVDGEAGYIDYLNSINIVIGSAHNDTFVGGASDEQFEGRAGDDFIDGGDGFDRVRYLQASGAVAVNLGTGNVNLAAYGLAAQTIVGGTAVGIASENGVGLDTFVNVEGVRGSDFNDVLVGGGVGLGAESFFAEVFEGLAGNDTLDGGDADASSLDYASYERSVQSVIVNLGATNIVYGDYTIAGGHALDGLPVNGVQGIDTFIGINAARGSSNADTLVGGAGDETFEPGRGNDSIVGGAGTDTLDYGAAGSGVAVNMFAMGTINPFGPTVQPGTASDGQGGIDTFSGIENVIGSGFNDYIQGNTAAANMLDGAGGNDTLAGGGMSDPGADDTLLGGDGDDVLRQGRGNDSIDGGDQLNTDRLEFSNNGIAYGTGQASVHVDLGAGTSNADRTDFDTVTGAGGDTATVAGIEYITGTSGDDLLVGGSLARSSSDSFVENYQGNAGNDTIDAAGGSVNAGRGFNDQVHYVNSTGAVNVNLATGTASDGFGGTDKLIGINWVRGSSFGDVLIGSDNTNAGRPERFEGRAGSDTINGAAGTDEVSYIQSSTGVTVNLQTGIASDGWGFTDALFNIERVRGSDHNDVLVGSNNTAIMERFVGEEGNDTINGGAGIDFAAWSTTEIEAGGINVFIENGSGLVDDGFGGTDTLLNIEGLEGSNLGDSLAGGAGGQWFRGRGGDDTLNGGAGIDTADYSSDNLGVVVNLGATNYVVGGDGETVVGGTARDGFGGVFDLQGIDTLIAVENVLGSAAGDIIIGSSGVNLLDGNLGNDTLDGGGGNDTLVGGTGNDSLQGNGGNDTLDGGVGDDVVAGGAGIDVFIDKTGADTLDGGADGDTFFVDYTTGAINATGGAGSDTYILNPNAKGSTYRVTDFALGQDLIDVGGLLDASAVAGFYTGQDPFQSGFLRFQTDGADKVLQWDINGAGNSYVNMITLVGLGAQTVTAASFKGFLQGSIGNNTLGGSTGDDLLLGLAGNDKLSGGTGNDQLFGGDGADTMTGGTGDDVYEVDHINDKVIEANNTPAALALPGVGEGGAGIGGITDTIIAAIDYTLGNLQYLENLFLTANALRATGNALNNHLRGNGGGNTLIGAAGNDTLDGGAGSDTMDGGVGNDLYIVDAAGDKVIAEATTGGTDTMQSSINRILDANVEHLVLTGNTAITGTGNAGNNSIVGNGKNNVLTGAAGNDTLDGGTGNDTMDGGLGNDLYIADATGDKVISESATGGTDAVHSTATFSLETSLNVENLVLLGNLSINGTGNASANRITGNGNDNALNGGTGTANDTLEGGGGNDTLDGGAGNDSMIGSLGDDQYVVSAGGGTGDKVIENLDQGHDTVVSLVTYTLGNHVEDLRLSGAAVNGTGNGLDNRITGNDGANALNGGEGDDTLEGGLGNDTLIGAFHVDILVGGDGNDVLHWSTEDAVADGGADFDTLRLAQAGVEVDFSEMPGLILVGIEAVDLANGGNTLYLNELLVFTMSSTSDELYVEGGATDTLVVDDSWIDDGVQGGYHVYSFDGTASVLRVSLDIGTVNIDAIA